MLEWSTCAAISLNHPENERTARTVRTVRTENTDPHAHIVAYTYIHAHGIHICIHTLSIYI